MLLRVSSKAQFHLCCRQPNDAYARAASLKMAKIVY